MSSNSKSVVAFVVAKYLKFDKAQPFISIAALLAFIGVAVGVFVLIVAMAIMNGFDKEFEKKLFTMNYPLTIYPKFDTKTDTQLLERLEKEFPKWHFSPFLRSNAIAKSGDVMEGVLVFGVDSKKESAINDVFAKSVDKDGLGTFEALVGVRLFEDFALLDDKKLTLLFASSEPQALGLSPTIKRFDVNRYFTCGLQAYDKGYVYANIDGVRRVLKTEDGVFDGIHVSTPKPMEDIKVLRQSLGLEFGIVGWWQQNGNFFSALALEKRALFIVLMLIILVASLNIISSLLMTVMSRRKEIALLLSLGATTQEIRRIFFYLGAVIGGSGIITGVVFGLLSVWALGRFDIIALPADVYGTSKLPLELSILDFSLIIAGSALIVTLSSWYPAKKASEIDVLSVLRNE